IFTSLLNLPITSFHLPSLLSSPITPLRLPSLLFVSHRFFSFSIIPLHLLFVSHHSFSSLINDICRTLASMEFLIFICCLLESNQLEPISKPLTTCKFLVKVEFYLLVYSKLLCVF